MRIFSSKGYRGATTREIAAQAGVAEVTLFRHFKSKEKLFRELLNRYSFLPKLKGLIPELKGLSYRDALLLIAGNFYDVLLQRKDLIRIVHGEILRSAMPDDVFEAFLNDMFETMASCFRIFQARGEIRRSDPEISARAFMGLVMSFFLMEEIFRKEPMNPKDRKRTLRDFVDIFIRGTQS